MTKAERKARKKLIRKEVNAELAFQNGYTNIDPLDGTIYNGYVEARIAREKGG